MARTLAPLPRGCKGAHTPHRVGTSPGRAPCADARAQGPGGRPGADELGSGDVPAIEGGTGAGRAASHPPGALPPEARGPRGGGLARACRAYRAGRRDPGDAEGLPPRARPLGPGSRVTGPGAGRGPVHGPRGLARGPHRAGLRPVRTRPAAAARVPARAGGRRRAQRGALRRPAGPLRAGDDHRPAPARARAAARVAGPAGGRPRRGTRRAGDLRRPPLRRRAPVAVHARAAGTPGVRPARRTAGPEHPPLHRRDPPHRRPAHDAHRPGKPVPRRSSARCTSAGTGCTSRASTPRTTARRSPPPPSMGLHESQSRLWENLVGRSLPFWGLPVSAAPVGVPRGARGRGARATFTAPSTGCGASPIRVEADEITYNLHIVLRTALEVAAAS